MFMDATHIYRAPYIAQGTIPNLRNRRMVNNTALKIR
jgi:hypothetical protein